MIDTDTVKLADFGASTKMAFGETQSTSTIKGTDRHDSSSSRSSCRLIYHSSSGGRSSMVAVVAAAVAALSLTAVAAAAGEQGWAPLTSCLLSNRMVPLLPSQAHLISWPQRRCPRANTAARETYGRWGAPSYRCSQVRGRACAYCVFGYTYVSACLTSVSMCV